MLMIKFPTFAAVIGSVSKSFAQQIKRESGKVRSCPAAVRSLTTVKQLISHATVFMYK